MIQEIIIYIALALAVYFILRKFIFKPKNKNCGGSNCGCN